MVEAPGGTPSDRRKRPLGCSTRKRIMPIYEFECGACGAKFEKVCRLSDIAPPPCPKCGAADARKKISAAVALGGGDKTTQAASPPPSSRFT
jgi:putative FmdB family regulatory protein